MNRRNRSWMFLLTSNPCDIKSMWAGNTWSCGRKGKGAELHASMSSNDKANQETFKKKVLVEFRCILKSILLSYPHSSLGKSYTWLEEKEEFEWETNSVVWGFAPGLEASFASSGFGWFLRLKLLWLLPAQVVPAAALAGMWLHHPAEPWGCGFV